ncbi:MAG TPA: ABC transporter permease [Pyrinomonadaceae bacterium]|nr:ABC transporter permease [Pyrinomonadaceae bacterium]
MWGKRKLWLRALFRREQMERELDRELRFHLEREMEENLRRGMSAEAARQAALRCFGGVERIKEQCREVRGVGIFETFLQDLRYGARMLVKHRGFTFVAVLTLALGIGANSAIFSVVNAVLLKPLPYKDPNGIVYLWERLPQGGEGSVSVPNLRDWQEQNDVFEHIAAYEQGNFSLQGSDLPERSAGASVTANFFDVLGVAPKRGRAFVAGEDTAGKNRVVVLSDQLWQRNFGSDPRIVNREVLIGGENYTVVGVMPPGFQFPSRTTELWVPLVFSDQHATSRGTHAFSSVARMKPGVTLEQAQEQMNVIARRLEQQYPDQQTKRGIIVGRLQEEIVKSVRPALLILLGAVGFVLLIACTNVANLLLARAAARRREIAIRTALGAGRARLVRQFLTESVLLSVAGGLVGLLVAKWSIDALLTLTTGVLPRAAEVGLDARVLGFTMLLSLVTGIVFGLAPALQTSRADVQDALKDGGTSGSSPRANWLRSILSVAQIASAIVLLVGAGLLVKSFVRLQGVESGVSPENVLTMRITLPAAKYETTEAATTFYTQLLERVSALPGVEAAGAINLLPVQRSGTNGNVQIVGDPPDPAGQAPLVEYRTATPDYFRALGIPLVAGRFFEPAARERVPVAIVNQTFVRVILNGRDALGKQIQNDGTPIQIVGVVRDVKQTGLTTPPRPEMFLPYNSPFWSGMTQNMSLVVRASSDPAALAQAIRREVFAVDPAQPVYNVLTMEQVLDESISRQRLNMTLLSIFAALATLLSTIGIYSVMSYLVTQHTREIGIRMALGAQPKDVLKLVLGQGLMLTLIGVVIGVAGALALTRLMETLLFGVRATDPLTFVGVSLLLTCVALLACYIPARRAMRVDPMVALRYE